MSLLKVTGSLRVSINELNLKATLLGGQSFRWKICSNNENSLVGVIEDKIVFLEQSDENNCINYNVYLNKTKHDNEKLQFDIETKLKDYFRLDINLNDYYLKWSSMDESFKEQVGKNKEKLQGIRVLRQQPVENIFSFICSQNNNIKRITTMVENLCIHYGYHIGKIDDKDYYSFPSIESLTRDGVESKLRALNFGYRAKYIYQAALYIQKYHETENNLISLRDKPYNEVLNELVNIPGIGNKVADCICLMSMDKLQAVPVDTHILKIARHKYKFIENHLNGKKKGLTKKGYNEIADKFRQLWGDYAGWAQTVLFIDDLKI